MPNLIKCGGTLLWFFFCLVGLLALFGLSLDSEAILLMAQWLACAHAASPMMEEDVQREHMWRDRSQPTGDTEVSTAIL